MVNELLTVLGKNCSAVVVGGSLHDMYVTLTWYVMCHQVRQTDYRTWQMEAAGRLSISWTLQVVDRECSLSSSLCALSWLVISVFCTGDTFGTLEVIVKFCLC